MSSDDTGADRTSSETSSGTPADAGADTTSGGETEGPEVLWLQDFEGGPGDWSVEGGVWEIGEPTALDGPIAFAGSAVAGTVLAGDYPSGTQSARLVSPQIDVPEDGAPMRLRFQRWTDFGSGDQGAMQVRVEGGPWVDLDGTLVRGRSGGWAQTILELDAFAGENVQIAFYFTTNIGTSVGPGWFVDDVSLERGPHVEWSSSSFEDSADDWSALGALWCMGQPTAEGGPIAHGGINVFGTTLDADYTTGRIDTMLITPTFLVADADENPRLRFQQWYDFGFGDGGEVQVRRVGEPWELLPEYSVEDSSNGWSQTDVPLAEYAASYVQVGFRMTADVGTSVGLGWYLDDVEYLPE